MQVARQKYFFVGIIARRKLILHLNNDYPENKLEKQL